MASNPITLNHGQTQILPNEEETPYSTPRFRPQPPPQSTRGGRMSSFSLASPSHDSWGRNSSFESSSFYFNEDFTPTFNPSTLNPLNFKGIPFSWEEIPGIPKQKGHITYKKEPSRSRLLPLPPPAGSSNISSTKKVHNQEEIGTPKKLHHNMIGNNRWDPFFAALIECSKDDDHDHGTTNAGNISSKKIIARTLSDRFGFISMYSSCKRTCAVSESIVYLPRPNPHHNYLLHRRSS